MLNNLLKKTFLGDHFGLFHVLLLDATFMLDDTLIQTGGSSLNPTQGSDRAREQLLQPHNLGALFHGLWHWRIGNILHHLDCIFHSRKRPNVDHVFHSPLRKTFLRDHI